MSQSHRYSGSYVRWMVTLIMYCNSQSIMNIKFKNILAFSAIMVKWVFMVDVTKYTIVYNQVV